MTRRLHHLLRAPFYLLGLLLLLELLLQLGALVVKDQTRLVPAQWFTDNTRILALGDSNTYGLYLDAPDAWPAHLERRWNAANPKNPVEVLNLGYPATNTFRVRANLSSLLDKLLPDVVLIMVGFNDFWTPLETLNAEKNKNLLDLVKKYSRLYRLYLIGSRSRIEQKNMTFGYPRGGVLVDQNNKNQRLLHLDGEDFYMGTEPGEPARNRKAMSDNLKAMIDMVRTRDMKVYFITYPSNWGFYPGANNWLKKVAKEQSVPLIDITPIFVERCVNGAISCPDILFHDGHATKQGNTLVADEVSMKLELIENR